MPTAEPKVPGLTPGWRITMTDQVGCQKMFAAYLNDFGIYWTPKEEFSTMFYSRPSAEQLLQPARDQGMPGWFVAIEEA